MRRVALVGALLLGAGMSAGITGGCATTSGATAGSGAGRVVAGQPAPAFDLPALEGAERVSLAARAGKVVLVDFWASWCGPCREELPALERLRATYEPRGAAFVGVNVDTEREPAAEMARQLGVTMPVGLDPDHKVVEVWQPTTMPTSYVVDRKGAVRFVHEGWHGAADETRLRAELDQLLAE